MSEVLNLLLRSELPDTRKVLPTKQFRVTRLSELTGADVVFTLRGLSYDKVREIQQKDRDPALYMVLEGCESPNFRDPALLDAGRGIVTPLDAIRARLSAGEIDEISVEVQKLSGYLRKTLSELKNG
ncbi:MAG: hypothetical protein RR426_06310 [Oscillospiraceae bacterium]